MKKALVINPLNTWWSFQLTLELAYRYKKLGYEVHWFNGAVKNKKQFEMNKSDYINPVFFRTPNIIIKEILNQDGIKGNFDFIKINNSKSFNVAFKDIEELRAYQFKGAPLGAIIFSGIASKYKHTGFTISEVSRDINYFLQYTSELRLKLSSEINSIKPDLVVSINDRLPGSALSLAIARDLNISTRVFYWGSGIERIVGYENSLYDFDEWRCMVSHNFLKKPMSEVEIIKIQKKIDDLATNPSNDSKRFLSDQIPGRSIKKVKKMIVFYATSEHEHSPLMYRKHNKFVSQYDAFNALQNICEKNNYQLILKYHPIRKKRLLNYKKNNTINDWKKIKLKKNVVELFPDSPVDTYQLMKDADVNVTWSSTVGLESIAREQATIIMGDAPWFDTKWGIHAWSKDNLESLVKSDSYGLKKDALIPWFLFIQDYGEPFEFVKTENYNPSVRGRKALQPRWLFVPFYKIVVKLKAIKII